MKEPQKSVPPGITSEHFSSAEMAENNRLIKANEEISERLQQQEADLSQQAEQMRQLLQTIGQQQELIREKTLENEKLNNQILQLLRWQYGRSSERYIKEHPDQLKLDFEGLDPLPEEQQTLQEIVESITYQRKKRNPEEKKKPVRLPLPDHLEREEETIEPENLPQGSVRIGEEVTEVLEYRPGKMFVRRIIRPKYALPKDEKVVIGELPTLPLPRSNAGASLLSQLLVSKYQDHLPFYRQIEMFKRQNVHIAASTVNGWFASSVDLLLPLYETLKKQVLSSDYLQVDESTIPVLSADKPGATRKGYHWIIRAPEERKLFFHYDQGSRAQWVVVGLLKDFKGALQSDGYGAYGIYEQKKDIVLLGCWAHARRKFEEALKNDAQRATYALEQIQLLYRLERQIQDEELSPEDAVMLRKTKAYPLMQYFEKWLEKNYAQVLPKSKIGQAIAYAHSIFPRLVRYVMDARYRIDNNEAENGVRPLALGRKNYLFCGNDQAAERTAVIYSLLGTCKINEVNPIEWLTDVFNRIPDYPANQLVNLLPREWAADRKLNLSLALHT